MGIVIGMPFDYQGKFFLDNMRGSFDTIAKMAAYPEYNVPDGYVTFCKEDGQRYEFRDSNSVDSRTGKWRILLRHQVLTQKEWDAIKDSIPEDDKTIRYIIKPEVEEEE